MNFLIVFACYLPIFLLMVWGIRGLEKRASRRETPTEPAILPKPVGYHEKAIH